MAHFYGSLYGNRGVATRQGTKQSGICGEIGGWDVGVWVKCVHDSKGRDVCWVYVTGGSNKSRSSRLIATAYDDGSIQVGEPTEVEG